MNKIGKFLKAIGLIAKQPSLLNNVLNDNDVWKKYVTKKYRKGPGLPVISIDDLFPDFQAELPVFAFLDGGSLPTDIALLRKLAESIKDCKYFEIGTWRGESVSNIADVAKECYTLNLSDEEMKTLKLNKSYIELHGFFSKKFDNVNHLKGDSRTFNFAALNIKFDLIFIDGDHHYEFVKNDTERLLNDLVHKDSIIVWHDYAYYPESVRFEVLAGILDAIPEAEHKNLYHVSNTMCAIFMNKKLPTHKLENPTEPKHWFELNLKLKK